MIWSFILHAGDRNRTGTGITTHGILSPGRLPVPPRQPVNGWRWIRTTEALRSRFTVCPLWPLGNPSIWRYVRQQFYIILESLTDCKHFLHSKIFLCKHDCRHLRHLDRQLVIDYRMCNKFQEIALLCCQHLLFHC